MTSMVRPVFACAGSQEQPQPSPRRPRIPPQPAQIGTPHHRRPSFCSGILRVLLHIEPRVAVADRFLGRAAPLAGLGDHAIQVAAYVVIPDDEAIWNRSDRPALGAAPLTRHQPFSSSRVSGPTTKTAPAR